MRSSSDNRLRLRIAKGLWQWEPHHTQRDWLLCDAQTKVASCGRRWGKTEAAAIDAITFALARPGSVQIVVAPTYDQSRLLFSTVERLALSSPATRRVVKITRTPYPKLTIGRSVLMARTADEDGRNLRGNSADRVIIDEAAYVRDSVVTEVVAPMLADRNGSLVMISTPFGKNHFYRAFLRGMESRRSADSAREIASFTFPSWANPHISRDYIEAQRAQISPRQFSVEYEAQFIDDASCVFPLEDVEAAARNAECGMENAEYVVAGIDWARYSDFTAVVALAVDESGCRVVGIDRFNRMGWDRQIERVADFLRTHRVSAALADSTSIGDPLLDQFRSRLWESGVDTTVEGYGFTNTSKQELIDNLALQFAHRSLAIPRDEQLMRELQYFEYELTQSGNIRMTGRPGINDDLVIALALACWQSRKPPFSGTCLSRNGRLATRYI